MSTTIKSKTIREGNAIATLTLARKQHRCVQCPKPILAGAYYYAIICGGAGLGSTKFPDRVHSDCLQPYFQTNIRQGRIRYPINPSGLSDGDWDVILHQGKY